MKSWPSLTGALADYVDANWLRDTPLKRRLREETGKMRQAGMQISAHQGQQMAAIARLLGARRCVEVGTFTGYSALCVAEVLPKDGKLWCCDVSEEWTAIARRYWKEAGVADRIELTIAPALETARQAPEAGACRPARHGLHRRRQDELRQLLRTLPQTRAAGRRDPDRQRAVGRLGRQSRRQGRGHRGDPQAECQTAEGRSHRPDIVQRRRWHDLRCQTVAK